MSSTRPLLLSQDKFTFVDDEDYEWLIQWKWHLHSSGYAARKDYLGKVGDTYRCTTVLMHRFILETPIGLHTDHIDNNRLNNSRENLRICTNRQNSHNQSPIRKGSSKYKGVTWKNSNKKWCANIRVDGVQRHLGLFNTESEAAISYNIAARIYYKDFAKLNEVL